MKTQGKLWKKSNLISGEDAGYGLWRLMFKSTY